MARTNAIAMLKRAASQREMKAKADVPALPGAFPSDPSPLPTPVATPTPSAGLSASDRTDQTSQLATTSQQSSDAHAAFNSAGIADRSNSSSDLLTSHTSDETAVTDIAADTGTALQSLAPATGATLTAPSANDSSELLASRSRSPMFQDRSNQRQFNRSPLPSLEQLRARILLERESAGLQRSASTSAASQAARAYALEKLLGNSGTDVFYDHTPDGTPISRGAATPSPTPMSGRDNDLADMASDDESAHETRLRRQSIRNRPALRRSRTVNGLTAMAEAQNKAGFVQDVFLAVPGPASNRISRIHQRRVERQSMFRAASENPTEVSVPEEGAQDAPALVPVVAEAASGLSRQQSQRQIARTEMMRKLSTRGRGNAAATPQPASESSQVAKPLATSAPASQHPRLPKFITNSPAVDESISPVGVVVRPPSSPVPPHASHLDNLVSPVPTAAFGRSLAPISAAGNDLHTNDTALAEDDPDVTMSPGLKASSSAASLASRYAPSTATNATARHAYYRDRESVMALLNNEDNFGFEASPSIPATSVDTGTFHSRSYGAAQYHAAGSPSGKFGKHGEDQRAVIGGSGDGFVARASASQDGYDTDNDGLQLDLSDTRRKRRRAGLVGLGLDSLPSQGAMEPEEAKVDPAALEQQAAGLAGVPTGKQGGAASSKRVSKLRQSLAQLRVEPTTQDLLLSPANSTDEEPLEDDAFYQLYSPAIGGQDDDDEDDDDDDEDDRTDVRPGHQIATSNQTPNVTHTPQRSSDLRSAATSPQGLGFIPSGASMSRTGPLSDADHPTTPPQRLFHRGIAAVPSDPSPSTETEFGDARRTPGAGFSPSGFNLPLRFSNSLMSAAQTMQFESPTTDRSTALRGPSRKTRGDWPMSIASSGTLPSGRESLEGHSDSETRLRSSEEGGVLGVAPAIGSPLLELPEEESQEQSDQDTPQPITTGTTNPAEPHFELLAYPSSRAKPSERVQAMLGSSFVARYGDDLVNDSQPRSPLGGDGGKSLEIPNTNANGTGSSRNHSNVSINEISDADGDVDDAYLRKVDRIADKLGKLAHTNTAKEAADRSLAVSPAALTTTSGQVKSATGSRFTERLSTTSGHAQRPSADLSALVGNEKLHPFPGLSQASPVLSQEGFSHMTISTAPSLSKPASTLASSSAPGAIAGPKDVHSGSSAPVQQDEQDPNGKQIGLFSSLRRKASSLRRTPSSAKEGGGFWNRKGRRDESPKLPSEATFISAPILTSTTPGPAPTAVQPNLTAGKPQLGRTHSTSQRDKDNDATFEHRLFDRQSPDKAAADLQRNASISSVVSARIRTDLQDGTADADGSSSSDHQSTSSLAPNTAAMIHRYSRMLSTSQPLPGASQEDVQDPPRKLLATDPVFQVISTTTIKDRYLFLFSDILVIAKPVAAPGAEAGQSIGKMKQAAVLPSLSWKFAVKNILELHRLKVSVTTNTRTASAKTRAQNPVLWGFVSHFSKDPDAAVRALVAKTGLEPTAASIAQLLYQTPELDRHDLTQYLGHPSRREILKAYVSQHRHVGVSIESALRSLLLDLRFPTDLDAFEALLIHFAQSWTQHNTAMIKPSFTPQLASDLVFAIMALNDALHTGAQAGPSSVTAPNFPRPVTVVTPGLFSAPCRDLSKADFVSVFRQHDPDQVLSDRTLSRIYLSIKAEPLVQALDRFEPRFTIRVKGRKLPTRLTYAQPAEPVTLVIPAPDPDLAIRLYAQDTTFEPPVLTFSTSREASFTMWTKSLGPKQVVFVRAGRNARFYGGTEVDVTDATNTTVDTEDSPLPRSFNATVERAFMKHSFTLSSVGPTTGTKRFMFSFEDGEKVANWTRMIREQAEASIKAKAMRAAAAADPTTFRATETAALQILRETLVVPDDEGSMQTASVGGGLDRAATISGAGANTSKPDFSQPNSAPRSAGLGLGLSSTQSGLRPLHPANNQAMLDRATSTSRHYYAASGVGRHERELLIPPTSSNTALLRSDDAGAKKQHSKGSASLSLYPPSTTITRLGAVSPASSMARSNSARSASSPHSVNQALHPPPSDGMGHGAISSTPATAATAADKVLPGTQIVNITRLNSLLSRVIAHHQAQAQGQAHQHS